MDKKVFVIINSYRVGDMILTNSLIQNIKRLYQDSYVVMLSSPQLTELAQNQQGVDEVIIWDRHGEHKGFRGMLKFATSFPYKKIYAIIPIWGLDRPMILAKLLNPKYVLTNKTRSVINWLIRKSKYKIISYPENIQKEFLYHLSGITKEELIDVPLKFNVDKEYYKNFNLDEEYFVLVPTSTRYEKELSNEAFIELVKSLKSHKLVLLGCGDRTKRIQEIIDENNFENVINLFNKTSILESADVIKHSKGVISVDTGLAHLTCALGVELLMVMYLKNPFIPDSSIYSAKTVFNNDEFKKEYLEFVKN